MPDFKRLFYHLIKRSKYLLLFTININPKQSYISTINLVKRRQITSQCFSSISFGYNQIWEDAKSENTSKCITVSMNSQHLLKVHNLQIYNRVMLNYKTLKSIVIRTLNLKNTKQKSLRWDDRDWRKTAWQRRHEMLTMRTGSRSLVVLLLNWKHNYSCINFLVIR